MPWVLNDPRRRGFDNVDQQGRGVGYRMACPLSVQKECREKKDMNGGHRKPRAQAIGGG